LPKKWFRESYLIRETAMMRLSGILATFVALSSISTALAVAQQDQRKAEQTAVPKEHERFFNDLSALAKKYPEAAARFRIVDPKSKTDKPTPKAGSFHACCEWTLSTPRRCTSECLE
jgi:hypothetical protein